MELRTAIRRRRMVRAYHAGRPVPRTTIDALIDLARRAPSAGHTQGWRFLVLDDPDRVSRFWSATAGAGPQDSWLRGMRTAPALILVFCDKSAYLDRYAEPDKGWTDRDESRWTAPFWYVDAGMASVLVLLGAVDSGLGACFFGIPADKEQGVRDAFHVPDAYSSVGVISLGHAAPDRRSPSLRRGRRPREAVVAYGSFDSPA